jgi:phosphatidylserine/phosphatidylglycerophosphate/cardiolipin synthase-like enzyme
MDRRRASRSIIALLLFYVFNLAIQYLSSPDVAEVVQPQSVGWYSLYFTNPEGASASTLQGGPDAMLAAAMDGAIQSIDVATQEIDLWSIRDALIRAHERGIQVRVVTETDYASNPEMQALVLAGIQVRGDERQPLMHNKFVVIDESEVWTGSMNLTVNGAYRNNNNLLRIQSAQLADQYTEEFEEMLLEDRFGQLSWPDVPRPPVEVEGTQIEVLFSPDMRTGDHIVALLQSAEESIHVMAFNLTLDAIADTILRRADEGIEVQGLFDADQSQNQGSDVTRFGESGIDVTLDGNPRKMHHKVIIIDESIVITGSYNFSRNAEEKNDENVLIIYSPRMAKEYLIEFSRLREIGTK